MLAKLIKIIIFKQSLVKKLKPNNLTKKKKESTTIYWTNIERHLEDL